MGDGGGAQGREIQAGSQSCLAIFSARNPALGENNQLGNCSLKQSKFLILPCCDEYEFIHNYLSYSRKLRSLK